jgi:hypothetical protein
VCVVIVVRVFVGVVHLCLEADTVSAVLNENVKQPVELKERSALQLLFSFSFVTR